MATITSFLVRPPHFDPPPTSYGGEETRVRTRLYPCDPTYPPKQAGQRIERRSPEPAPAEEPAIRLVDKDGDGKFNSEGETIVWLEGTPPLERVHALDL